jgi:lipoate-protein ligase A
MNIELYNSPFNDPYINLGVEETLFETCPPDTLRFYLWQNAHTVVIGKNQHAQSEVALDQLIRDHGKLARRSSGGGAVYHDMGNLNFTFILDEAHYDVKKQMNVIARALRFLGFPAVVSGRNDIEIDGAKVSGNAFLKRNGFGLHHGTILHNVDKEKLGMYLTVSEAKLKRKQVASVKARIVNLNDLKPVTLDEVKQACLQAISEEYGVIAHELPFPFESSAQRIAFFGSDDWLYGKHFDHLLKLETYLTFGSIRWEFESVDGIITHSMIYSDAMDVQWIQKISDTVIGLAPDPMIIADRLESNPENDAALIELIAWLRG